MGQVKNNDSFLGKAEKLKPVLKHRMLRPVGVVSFERKKADSGADEMICSGTRPIQELPHQVLGKGQKLVLDFGDHQVGYVSFTIDARGSHFDAPAYIRLKFAERPSELFDRMEDCESWISKSWIQEEFLHIDMMPQKISLPRRYAFRYLQAEVIDTSSKYGIVIDGVSVDAVSAVDMADIQLLDSGDMLLDRIDRVGAKTLMDCMQSVFEDGPKRDRRLWLGDLRLQALANYETFKNYDMVKRCLYLFAGSTFSDGRIAACLFLEPEIAADDSYLMDYALLFGAILWEYYQETGDAETLRELYPRAIQQIDLCMELFVENDLVKEQKEPLCLLDWTVELDRQAGTQGVLIYSMGYGVKLAGEMGDGETARRLVVSMERLRQTARESFWEEEKGAFVSGSSRQVSWATQVWMVLADVPGREESWKLLLHMAETGSELPMITPYMYHYYVEALLHCGMKDEAVNVIRNYWGGMVNEGADTFWELYNPANPDESPYGSVMLNSFCHAWSCTPSYLLRKL